MRIEFKVFRIESGQVVTDMVVPSSLRQVARDAYRRVRIANTEVEHERVETMAGTCYEILAKAEAWDPEYDGAYYRDDDSEAEKVNDLLNLCDSERRFRWRNSLPGSESLRPSHMMAAYALHKADSAAAHYLKGEMEPAIEALALACLAAADYSFHEAHDDYGSMVRADGTLWAHRSRRMKALEPTKAYAIQRWRDGRPDGTKWKSKQSCAAAIAEDVVLEAKRQGWAMREGDTSRTVYKWLREAVDV